MSFIPQYLIINLVTCYFFIITVINELEGLSRGIKPLHSSTMLVVQSLTQQMQERATDIVPSRRGDRNNPQHAAIVAEASKQALSFLKSKNPAVK